MIPQDNPDDTTQVTRQNALAEQKQVRIEQAEKAREAAKAEQDDETASDDEDQAAEPQLA